MNLMEVLQIVLPLLGTLALPFIAYYIRKLEKNTNSLKDALVKVTGESEHAKGVLEGQKLAP